MRIFRSLVVTCATTKPVEGEIKIGHVVVQPLRLLLFSLAVPIALLHDDETK